MVDISVIIVSYNTKALLRQCLDSVFRSLKHGDAGSMAASYEVFVVDNDSQDGSVEMVSERFPDVTLLRAGRNLGFAAANNLAMERASGRYVLFLNPDAVVVGNALWELAGFMDIHPDTGVATGSFICPDGSFQEGAFSFPTLWGTLLDFFPFSYRLMRSKLNGRYPPSSYAAAFEIDYPLGACFMVRREALCDVGSFSEDFFLYCEELEWCWRIKKAGWRIYCYPTPTIVHYGGQSTKQRRDEMFLQLHRSRLIFFKKHYSPLFCAFNRMLVATGVLWEMVRALRAARSGDGAQAHVSRIKTCAQIFKLAVRGG